MSWQIQCKQHFLKQLYTLNNQLESKETLTWHKDVQMYCWDCMRVRGGVRGGDYNECWACMRVKREAMFCCWMCMRVERGAMFWWVVLVYESWEWEEQCLQCSNELSLCMRVESERDLDLDKTRWDPDMTSQRGAIIDHI